MFRHRQTIGSAVRFSTDELSTLASRISEAADRALAIERECLISLPSPKRRAAALALASPERSRHSMFQARLRNSPPPRAMCGRKSMRVCLRNSRGRHPVVESGADASGLELLVPNDCNLSPEGGGRIWLVTGPNMAGKSTFLRQNALIAILAQMGAFVPAESAHIGVIDRLFSRVGAADDLARGRSTFMVEMVETAAILNRATERSFVILDEIGRGTATFDGLAIAWAAVEHLHADNRSRALFATHYHEMTALADASTARLRNDARQRMERHDCISARSGARCGGPFVWDTCGETRGSSPAVITRAEAVLRAWRKAGRVTSRSPGSTICRSFRRTRCTSTPRVRMHSKSGWQAFRRIAHTESGARTDLRIEAADEVAPEGDRAYSQFPKWETSECVICTPWFA